MAKLTAKGRKRIKKKNFAFQQKAPGSGSYPIHSACKERAGPRQSTSFGIEICRFETQGLPKISIAQKERKMKWEEQLETKEMVRVLIKTAIKENREGKRERGDLPDRNAQKKRNKCLFEA